jgi:predicted esterase
MDQVDLSVTAQIKLYYDLYVPGDVPGPPPLLIAVHGYGAHKRYMMREAKTVADDKFVIVSIQAPYPHYRPTEDGYRIGYGWLAGEERSSEHVGLHQQFVLDVVEQLDRDGLIDRGNIFMFGFSQACALNFRFAFTHPEILRGIVGVCGGIPSDLEANDAYKPFTGSAFYLYGDDDEFYSQDQFAGFDKKLASVLPDYRSKHYAAKHEITNEMRADIREFLAARAGYSTASSF